MSINSLMKILALILLLMLIPLTLASTYTLGSHQVSFNVSEPYNSSARLDKPFYLPDKSWAYTLNMTDGSKVIEVIILELSKPDYSRTWTNTYGELRALDIEESGIGGYKSSTMDFKGYPAYQESYPAQTTFDIDVGKPRDWPKRYGLLYEIDEKTIVEVHAIGDNIPYQEILDTIEVTDAPIKPTKYAPYISSSAGNSTSE